jgi:hypothetical protein
MYDYLPEQQPLMRKFFGAEPNIQFSRHVPSTAMAGIIDKVRTIVLKWALELEKQGILGEGMTFSDAEKQKATSPSISIQNFMGEMRVNTGSTDNSVNTVNISTIFSDVRDAVQQLSDLNERAEVLEKIDVIEKTKSKKTALEKYSLLAGLTSNSISISNVLLPLLPQLMAWIGSKF